MTHCYCAQEIAEIKKVIIVTGTPGVGKTAVSQFLAEKLGASHIDIGEIVKSERLTAGFDRQRATLIADEERLKRRVQELIDQCTGNVIVDGHYATSIVPKKQVTRAFVLRCHPSRLKERMDARDFKGTKLGENLAAEILDVSLYDAIVNLSARKVCEIDTTNKTVDVVAHEIVSILEGKGKCSVGVVDWLGRLEEEGSLDYYLKQF